MTRISTTTLILALFWLSISPASGSKFEVLCDGGSEQARHACTIKLSGPIATGDASRLRETLRTPLHGNWYYHTLLLDSPGGDVAEALRLAQVIRQGVLDTSTLRLPSKISSSDALQKSSWPCVSACFLVWVAGAERSSHSTVVPGEGNVGIGLHRPYFAADAYSLPAEKVAEAQQSMTAQVREYLRREQVPESFIDKMLERSSREVYWLHESGDEWALNGRAAWFEEMMIARCAFDPVYDRESEARSASLALKHGAKVLQKDRAHQAHLKWRQEYNACEYDVRRKSQEAMRK